MKNIAFWLFIFVTAAWMTGCAYPNECGVSLYYYNDKKTYYDSQGNYHEECPQNNFYEYDEKRQQYLKQPEP